MNKTPDYILCPKCHAKVYKNTIGYEPYTKDYTKPGKKAGIMAGKIGGKLLAHTIGGAISTFSNNSFFGHAVSHQIGKTIDDFCEDQRNVKNYKHRVAKCPECGHEWYV